MMEETLTTVESPLNEGSVESPHHHPDTQAGDRQETDLRASLLASLIGEENLSLPISTYSRQEHIIQDHLEEDVEEDLFGRITLQDSYSPALGTIPSHSSLLSSSGLLEVPFQGSGSGLFDDIDAEEQRTLRAAKQRQLEEEDLRRRKEEEERQKALEQAIRKEEEDRKRFAEEREKQRIAEEKEEEQKRIYQEEQKKALLYSTAHQGHSPKVSSINTTSGAVHDLRLNGAGDLNQQYDNVSVTTNPMGMDGAGEALYIGNTSPIVQGGFLAHIADSKLSHLQRTPIPPHSRMTPVENLPTSTLQQAGYGWASYYYSTSGNMQQIVHNPPQRSSIPQQNPKSPPKLPTGVPSTSPGYSMQSVNLSHMDVAEEGMSYAQRSQMMRHNSLSSTSSQTHSVPRLQASKTAGMHNTPTHSVPLGLGSSNGSSASLFRTQEKFDAVFGPITVSDPILVQSPGLFAGPPYWSYAVSVWHDENTTHQDPSKAGERVQLSTDAKMVSSARRRFRHFIALEDRLRRQHPGAILPPRPDKHAIRAFEEASPSQSSEFAQQRAVELETYLNELRMHPITGNSSVLRLFLTLPDHIGVAWPEVSSSIITRLSEFGTNAAVKVVEGTSQILSEINSDYQAAAGEDNAEILALASSEGLRIASVLQAVPKLEGNVFLLAEHGEKIGICGLECQKLVRQEMASDKDMSVPFEILSSGLLFSGRKMKAFATDLGTYILPFQSQHKLCRYESMVFGDRRSALARRRDARKEADSKAQKLVMHQHSLNSMGKIGMLEKMEMEAALADENAVDAVREADEIGRTLQREVRRITELRLKGWSSNLCSIVQGYHQLSRDQVEIWERCRDDFLKEYPMPKLSLD